MQKYIFKDTLALNTLFWLFTSFTDNQSIINMNEPEGTKNQKHSL